MQPIDFEEVLEKIVESDRRYHRDAYLFLREALDHTQKQTAKARKGDIKHVTGKELLDGIRKYALDQFGPMTLTVFAEWGLQKCDDFGDLVFNMVDHGLLAKTEEDRREDFKGGYEFIDAFRKPFLPIAKLKSLNSIQNSLDN
jgi:uncharacterized repeat protein (TIGR04138 family)